MSSIPSECHICFSPLEYRNVKGKLFNWKKHTIALAHDFETLACTKCEELLINVKDMQLLGLLLESSFNLTHKHKSQQVRE